MEYMPNSDEADQFEHKDYPEFNDGVLVLIPYPKMRLSRPILIHPEVRILVDHGHPLDCSSLCPQCLYTLNGKKTGAFCVLFQEELESHRATQDNAFLFRRTQHCMHYSKCTDYVEQCGKELTDAAREWHVSKASIKERITIVLDKKWGAVRKLEYVVHILKRYCLCEKRNYELDKV